MNKKLKLADKPGSVYVLQRTTVIHLGVQLLARSSNLPAGSASHALLTEIKTPAYLVLLRMEVTAFHPFRRKLVTFATRRSSRLVSVALFRALYLVLQAFNVRPLAVIPLCAARTFLPPLNVSGDCLASFKRILPCYAQQF